MRSFASIIALAGIASANYRSGEVKTYEKFTYGRFTVRMQGASKNGTCASFFTFWGGPGDLHEGWNEIDIELVPSISGSPYSTNIIWQNQQQSQDYCWGKFPGTDWHEYAIEWTPEYVAWKYDGMECRRKTGGADVAFLNKEHQLMMNFWTPTFQGWGDNFSDWDMPWYTRYDYVQVETYNT